MERARFRIFTLFMVALAGAGPNAYASAAIDGCARLASTIDRNLQGAVRTFRLDAPSATANQVTVSQRVVNSPVSCGTAAAVASAAFSGVMSRNGWSLSWGNGGLPNPGDYCESHYISQCYPELQHGGVGATAADHSFVRNAWLGVQNGLSRHMPFGPQSDIAFFQPEQLGTTLQISLDLSLMPSPLPERRVFDSRLVGGKR